MRQSFTVRPAFFHPKARQTIQAFPKPVRLAIGGSIFDLQRGAQLSMPMSRPMPDVAPGVHELRLRGADGAYRVFYYVKSIRGVVILHAFEKKTQKTPPREMEVCRKRLREFLDAGELT